jgi:riboflavin kinase/FMN adenylyltransferase
LTTFERRAALLREAGADNVVRLVPTAEMLTKEPDAFLHDVVRTHLATHLVEGHDFRFGQKARGTTRTLEVLAQAWGLHAEIVEPVEVDLLDQSVVRASSSLVRELVACGRVRDAARVLARPHEVIGEVRQGDQRGRTIGFPTANVAAETLVPADGVYAATAVLDDGSRHPAAVNIGTRPTFQGVDRRVEAHLIGASMPMAYGWRVRLEFHSYVRDQVRFDGVPRLVAQLKADCRRTLELLECDAKI